MWTAPAPPRRPICHGVPPNDGSTAEVTSGCDIQEEPSYSVLQQLNDKMDNIALSVQQVQTTQNTAKQVTFDTPQEKRSASRSPSRHQMMDQDRYRQSPRQPWTPPRQPWTPPWQTWMPTQRPWIPTRQPWTTRRNPEMNYTAPRSDSPVKMHILVQYCSHKVQ